MSNILLQMEHIQKSYPQAGGEGALAVLKGANLALQAGEVVALVGPSGSGKSTLLHVAGLLDVADSGALVLFGDDAAGMKDAARTQLRREKMGFIYQAHHLLPELTAQENVMMPLVLQGVKKKDAIEKANAILAHMGLAERAKHRPAKLSGGEAQRVAIARALVHAPKLILADEPTGNLDAENTQNAMRLFIAQVKQTGAAALIVTHSAEVAKLADRTLTMRDGTVE